MAHASLSTTRLRKLSSCTLALMVGDGINAGLRCCDGSCGSCDFSVEMYAASSLPPIYAFVRADYDKGESPSLDSAFTAAWLQLMANVTRSWYGTEAHPSNTTFFAVLGPMSPTLPANATLAAVEQGTAAGFRVVFVNATEACGVGPSGQLTGCSDGCASHPGVASHRAIARTLAPVISAEMGWPMPGSL
jgi:hypothetical protein